MTLRRSLSWSTAMHELRGARRVVANVLRNADNTFNKSGIMREAIRLARQLRGPLTWARKLSISLRTAWAKARKAGPSIAQATTRAARENAAVAAYVAGWRQDDTGAWFPPGVRA